MFSCSVCNKIFSRIGNLKRHEKNHISIPQTLQYDEDNHDQHELNSPRIDKKLIQSTDKIREKFSSLKAREELQPQQLEDEVVSNINNDQFIQSYDDYDKDDDKNIYDKDVNTINNQLTEDKNKDINYNNQVNEREMDWEDTEDSIEVNDENILDSDRYYLRERNEIISKYINQLKLRSLKIDRFFGIRIDRNKLMIGKSNIIVFKDRITIDETSYNGTIGLYELLFMRKPNKNLYNSQDLDHYKQIIKQSLVYSKKSNPFYDGRSKKFKEYISKLMPHIDGSGEFLYDEKFMKLLKLNPTIPGLINEKYNNNNAITSSETSSEISDTTSNISEKENFNSNKFVNLKDDDPNKLVERLKRVLLQVSEISVIIEELRTRNIIE